MRASDYDTPTTFNLDGRMRLRVATAKECVNGSLLLNLEVIDGPTFPDGRTPVGEVFTHFLSLDLSGVQDRDNYEGFKRQRDLLLTALDVADQEFTPEDLVGAEFDAAVETRPDKKYGIPTPRIKWNGIFVS